MPPRILSLSPTGGAIVGNTGLADVRIRFNEPVQVPVGTLIIRSVAQGRIDQFTTQYDAATNTLSVHIDPPIRNDLVTIVVDYTVTDDDGDALDGEIAVPSAPSFPSGDGLAGGQAVFRFAVLQGDADRNGIVSEFDGAAILASFGRGVGDPRFDPLADLNRDAFVNVLDVAIWLFNLGAALPATDGIAPLVTGFIPDPAVGLLSDLSTLEVQFSEPIDALTLDVRTAYVVDSAGTLHVPATAKLGAELDTALYSFDPALPQCDVYTVRVSNSLSDPSGALLGLSPSVQISGVSQPGVPTIDPHDSATRDSIIHLCGATFNAVSIEVSGPGGTVKTDVFGGVYAVDVPLGLNRVNQLFVTAISACATRSAPVVTPVIQDGQAPNLFIDFPSDGAEIQADTTDVAGRVSDMLSGFDGLRVTVNGQAAHVDIGIGTNGTFFLPGLVLSIDEATIIETIATDALGNQRTRQITVLRVEIPPGSPRMQIASGNGQSGPIAQTLPDPIEVLVLDGDGTPLVNKTVTFDVSRSNGRLSAMGGKPGALMLQVRADAAGLARAFWTLGSDAGMGNNRVEVTSTDIAGTIMFCASATPGPATQINIGSGNNQRLQVGTPASEPLRVFVHDGQNGISDVAVTFTVTDGSGTVDGQAQVVVLTSPTGHAQVNLVLDPDQPSNRITADFEGNPGLPAAFVATGVVPVSESPTTLTGLVLDNASRGIGEAECALLVGGSSVANTTTDIEGRFTFSEIPAGPARVHVNGLVATTVGGEPIDPGSFPALEVDTLVVPEAANTLSTPILLPMLDPVNARRYDTTADVELTVQGIEGLVMTVRAGTTVTLPDGSVASPENPVTLSLNQVHFDDVPMPMPDGAAPTFTWTLQPAGTTFDPPLPIEMPNVAGLPAGAVVYFLVFDHATEEFQIVATGSSSPDGAMLRTDPGGGISTGGWGGFCPPYPPPTEAENCAGGSGWGLVKGLVSFTVRVGARVLGLRDAFDCGGGLVETAFNANRTYETLKSDGNLTQQEIAQVLTLITGAKGTAITCVAAFTVADPSDLCDDIVDFADVVKDGIEGLLDSGCTDSSNKAVLNLASRTAGLGSKLCPLVEKFSPKKAALLLVCETMETVRDRLLQEGPGDLIEDLDKLFAQLDGNMADFVMFDQEIMDLTDGAEQDVLEWQPELESILVELENNPELAGCTISVAGRSAVANEAGGFLISNLPNGTGLVRVGIVCDSGEETLFGVSPFFTLVPGATITITDAIALFPTPSPVPLTLSATTDMPVLRPGEQTQIIVTGQMSDGTQAKLPGPADGTTYQATDANVASVDENGLVTAGATGRVFIIASNQGATAVKRITVAQESGMTTVEGFVRLDDGTPVEDAVVTLRVFGGKGVSGPDGFFSFDVTVPVDPSTRVTVQASATIDGQEFIGARRGLTPIIDGITDAGLIILSPEATGPLFPGPKYAAGNEPASVAIGDLNGDGNPDLAVANFGGFSGGDVSVLLGNGDGTFAAEQRFLAGDSPQSVAIGDLDGDGIPDLAVATRSSDNVSVLRGNGDGTFAAEQRFATGSLPQSVAIGDLNGDGIPDLAVANKGSNRDSGDVSVLLGNGDGTFPTQQRFSAGATPFSLAIGDLNGDRIPDLAVASGISDDVSVLLGNGDGTFAGRQGFAAGSITWSVAIGDLDGDGNPDLAVANEGDDDVSVLLGNGDGTFAAQQRFPAGNSPRSVAIGDLDGDGNPDLAVANRFSDNVSVLLGNGDGTFADQLRFLVGTGPTSVAIGDLDGDGDPDLAVASGISDDVSVLLGNGDGTFAGRQGFAAGSITWSVAIGDLDGDGNPDLAVANEGDDDVSVLLGNGDGTFAAPLRFAAGDHPQSIAIGDLDGDGNPDLAVANFDSDDVSVLLGDGDGTFAADLRFAAGDQPHSVAIGDLNGDGKPDLAVANRDSDDVSILLNQRGR